MPFALLLAIAPIAGATMLTYFYDREAVFWARLCIGVCAGLAALGLMGFVLASWLGMTPLSVGLAGLLAGSPLLLLARNEWRHCVGKDIRECLSAAWRAGVGILAFYLCAVVLFWCVSSHAMYENSSGIFTGLDTNLGDLPFHLSIITGFVYGENFPPQHPEFAGVPMTYPFVADFVTAMFVRAGAPLQTAFFWQNCALMLALTGLLHRWALRLTGDRAAAMLTPVLVMFSGGLGWLNFLREAARREGMFGLIRHLPHDYTVGQTGYRWGNAITALFVPQRGILLGVALALIVWTLWWEAGADESSDTGTSFRVSPYSRMAAAGVIAGLLPLVHAHSFAVIMAMGGCLALLQARVRSARLPWLTFLVAATAVGTPQILWAIGGSALQGGDFLAWEVGWDHGADNIIWFWIKNTAFFIPLIVAALVWCTRGRLSYFYLPFTLCFIVPNLFRLAPWIWDNIKILFYWWIASAPLVALVLARLWRQRLALRALAVALLAAQTGAGALDVWRAASGTVEQRTFDPDGLRFAEFVRRTTPPQSLILHAPTYNDPIYMTGRRTFLGYAGHLWSHGLDYTARENELRRIYIGASDAEDLLAKNGIEYVVVGPLEEAEMKNYGLSLNRTFFERYTKVGEEGGYRLYSTAQP